MWEYRTPWIGRKANQFCHEPSYLLSSLILGTDLCQTYFRMRRRIWGRSRTIVLHQEINQMACHRWPLEEVQTCSQALKTWLSSRDSRILEFHHISQTSTWKKKPVLVRMIMCLRNIFLPMSGINWRIGEETSIGWLSNIFDLNYLTSEEISGRANANRLSFRYFNHVSLQLRPLQFDGCS